MDAKTESDVYINVNNVEISIELYEKLSEIYSKSYLEFIPQEIFDVIKNNNLDEIEIIEFYDTPLSRAAYHQTNYKSLKMIKNGTHITLMLSWIKMPETRSYDVIGIRFTGSAKLSGSITFLQTYKIDTSLKYSSTNYVQNFSNGFGTSFLLPSGDINMLEESIDFNISGSGTIFGSYQHAQNNVSLANSKKYRYQQVDSETF